MQTFAKLALAAGAWALGLVPPCRRKPPTWAIPKRSRRLPAPPPGYYAPPPAQQATPPPPPPAAYGYPPPPPVEYNT